MEMNKATLTIDGATEQFNYASPFTKVDKARRLVSGYATANNVDTQKDMVSTEASMDAFQRARGNVREMHEKSAVGKVVDYKVDTFIADDGNTYEGVYVTAYISKGAEDAWEKVLDGTYSGFSIGGNITDSETKWVKDANGAVRFIKAYDLAELSLVDNPANQLANIFSIQKSLEPTVNDIELESAFLCRTDEVARTSDADTLKCVTCGDEMEFMGWVETAGDMNKAVTSLMTKFLTPETNEGGVNKMTDESKKVDSPLGVEENGITDPEVVETPTPEGAADETPDPEPEAENETPNTDEPDVEKMLAEVRDSVAKQVAAIEEKIESVSKATEVQMEELGNKFAEAMTKLDSAKTDIESVTKRLGVVEGKSAIRKSADVESVPNESLEEPANPWTGAFFDEGLE